MKILSIQSHVVYGHVGNSAAVFPLERMGIEVLPLNTVQFSSHTGYGQSRGMVFPKAHIVELWEGLKAIGRASICDAVLSGYLGTPEIGAAILEIVASIREKNPSALYCCDPVMGDYERGLYVKPGIFEFFRDEALPLASIIKPNQFEAGLLSGIEIDSVDNARRACSVLHAKGPTMILLTSLDAVPGPGDQICAVLSLRDKAYIVRTPRFAFPVLPHGAGDMASALFLGYYLKSRDPVIAFEKTANAVHRVFEASSLGQSRELDILAAQDTFAGEERMFGAERIW
ncbi:MAG TPA: pyridoxal kinase PdxY [Rectinemataceae bacterium]|nr:pyridoxal kinase PdxY [Rectinemataceae bacterium]